MKVLGIDPGTANGGFAFIDGSVLRDLSTFRSDKDDLLRNRVAEYARDLLTLIDETTPDVIVAEAPSFPKGAKAAVMVWSAFTGLIALCMARQIKLELRNPAQWRTMLGLPQEKLPPAKSMDAKARAKLAREAQARRKAATVALMTKRWPRAAELLEATKDNAREHAWDALAIATSWTDTATATATATATGAQGELTWHER